MIIHRILLYLNLLMIIGFGLYALFIDMSFGLDPIGSFIIPALLIINIIYLGGVFFQNKSERNKLIDTSRISLSAIIAVSGTYLAYYGLPKVAELIEKGVVK